MKLAHFIAYALRKINQIEGDVSLLPWRLVTAEWYALFPFRFARVRVCLFLLMLRWSDQNLFWSDRP